jgi:DHA2 family multidrug resistance protein-like MFS transporter
MDRIAAAAPGVRAGRREWIGLAVLALPTLLLALDFGVLFLALPRLGADLHAGSTQLLWIMDVYGFMIAGFLVTMGTLGDRIGRRRLLMIGAAAFGLVSVLAAYSTSANMLIVTRALLGIAGATLMPSTLALISNMFRNASQRATAISLWASCLLVGVAVGPVIGGVLLQMFWWGSVFLIGVPVMVVLLIAAPILLPEYRDTTAGRLDLTSVGLSLAAILPIIYGMKELARSGVGTWAVVAVVVGLAAGIAFVRRQRRLPDPLLDLRLFADRAFRTALVLLLFGALIVGGIGFLFAQYLQLVKGFDVLPSGLWLVPDAIALMAGSLLAPVLARRVPPGYVIAAGLAISTEGLVVLTQVTATSGVAVAVTGVVLLSFGIAPTWVLGTDLVLGSAPPERAGSASSLSETGAELGVALGVAIMGSISTAVYHVRLADHVPAALPAGAADAARDTIIGAAAGADQLPRELGAALLSTARDAFTGGLNIAAAVGAPATLIFGVLAVILLRRLNPAAEPPQDEVEPVVAGLEQDDPVGARAGERVA